ncbi:MAG: hypothetical protein ISR96_01165 [Nitrospira sp.]|nr:hypothetical protein [Nitrospira sp.]
MFWDSLYSALNVMTYWQTYISLSIYLLLMLTPVIILFLIFKKNHALHTMYFKKLLVPIIEAVSVALAVLTLFPIILHLGEDASWGFPLRVMKLLPGSFLGLLSILIILAYIIDVIPVFRKLQSMKMLLLGAVSLAFVQLFLSFINPIIDVELGDFIPGYWFICGILITSAILSKLGHFVFISMTKTLGNRFNLTEEVAELLILPLIATLGFLPIFIYGAWLS